MTRPGAWVRAVASRVFGPHTVSRLIDPTVTDMQTEWDLAIQHGARWRARWVQLSGYVGLFRAVALYFVTDAVRHGTAEDRQAVVRAVAIAGATGLVVAALLATWPLTTVWRQTQSPLLVLYLVPQVVPIALPVGLTIGVLFGLPSGSVSTRMIAAVCLLAGVCTLTSFATTGWIIPIANQSFRTELGVPPRAKSVQEMTSVELWHFVKQGETASGRSTSGLARTLHTRSALAFAAFVLAAFALALVTWRRWSRWALLAAACAGVGAYWFLMERGDALARAAVVSPVLGAWAANVVFTGLCVLIVFRIQRNHRRAPRC